MTFNQQNNFIQYFTFCVFKFEYLNENYLIKYIFENVLQIKLQFTAQ